MAVRILRSVLAVVLAALFATTTAASSRALPALRPAASTSTAALQRSLAGYLRDAGGSSSALVVDQTTGRTLYAASPNTRRLPASVEKLFTTSAALFDFGSAGSFSTRIYGDGTLSDGVLRGRLYLRGGGDPTFGAASFNDKLYGTGATLGTLLHTLRSAGVREIKGSILGDATIFDDHGGGPDSGYRTSTETEGELSGLSYDAGWTSSSEVALQTHPALWAAQALAAVAPSQGITVARGTTVSTGRTPAGARLLASISSPGVSTLLKLTNAPSDNFFAETLDKDLGADIGGSGSTSEGAKVVAATVRAKLGLSEQTIDGSGLSRADRTTATTVVELLEEMQPSSAFYDSLAVAGVSGTMVDEMLNTPAANNCRGKTGTLHDVANLVGYCTAANGDRIIFAFLENGLHDSTYGHETEDLMGETLANYSGSGQGPAAPIAPRPNAGASVPVNTGKASGAAKTTAPTTKTPAPTATTPTTTTPGKGTTTATSTTPTLAGGTGF